MPNQLLTPELGQTFMIQMMEMYVNPEVKRRQTLGIIPKPYPLTGAQIIFWADGRELEVRLNKEIKAIATIKYNQAVNKGDAVYENMIEEVLTNSIS